MHIRRGSVLLETMIAIFMLSICISVSLNSIIQQIKCSNSEDENSRDNYSIKAVCSEIKYNVTYDKILTLLISGNKSIKYSNDFALKIINTDLTAFESPESEDKKISIEKISENEEYLNLKITIQNDENKIEQEIIKARWMDEI